MTLKNIDTNNIRIRLATNADVNAIKVVVFTVLEEYQLIPDKLGEDKDLNDIERYYTRNKGHFHVLVNHTDDTIIGTIGLFHQDISTCQVRKMFLLKEYRGQGLGRLMMERIIEIAKNHNYKKLTLETISVFKEAIALYEKYGFRKIPARQISDRVDHAYELNLDSLQEAVYGRNKNRHYFWGDCCEGWHLLDNPNLSVIREKMPHGTSERLHYHEKAQQLFYILSGTATFKLNGAEKTVSANESFYIPPKTLHNISNRSRQLLEFLLISQPKAQADRIEILEFSSETKDAVKALNYEWLNKYFKVEPRDVISLSNPQKEIIEKGGMIFYASRNNEIVGTASLLKITNNIYELGKMAVTEKAQGHYIGNALIEHCINVSGQKGIEKLILYSNIILKAAMHLYKKYGFSEVPIEEGYYERANVKMEKNIIMGNFSKTIPNNFDIRK